jgi:hypothetical protein
VNPPKGVFDLAPSTLERKQFWYVNLRTEEIEDLDARKDISIQAKWTWLRLKAVFLKSEQPGILVENDRPMTMEALAIHLRRRKSSIPVLEREITELLENRVLRTHAGFIYDLATLADAVELFRKKTRKSLGSFEEVLQRFPKVFPKFWENSVFELSASADSSDAVSEDESEEDSGKGENSNIRSSHSQNSSPTKRRTTGLLDKDRSARESAGTGPTNDDSPDLPAVAGIPANWEAELTPLYPDLNLDAEFRKWAKRCAKDRHEKTREWFEGFLELAVKHAEAKQDAKRRKLEAKAKREAEEKEREAARKAKAAEEEALSRAQEARLKAEQEAREKARLEQEEAQRKAREEREVQSKARKERLTAEAWKLEPMPHTEEVSDHVVFDVYKCNRGEFTSKEILAHGRLIGAVKGYGPYIGKSQYERLVAAEKEGYHNLPF